MAKEKIIKNSIDRTLKQIKNQRLHREWLIKQIRKEEAKKNENI
tara:strand:+ start:1342 stop:1473 length:132 start_codon:yes stop_codon:yes gene_type:complete